MPVREPKLYTVNALADELHIDRRTLKKWLADVEPDSHRSGNPVYRLAAVQAVVNKRMQKRRAASSARERLMDLQCEKIATWIAITRKQWLPVEDVARWAGELGGSVRKIVLGIHLCAPSVVGVSVADAEARLKEVEDDILQQLNLIDERITASNENQTQVSEPAGERFRESIEAHGETLSELLRESRS